jgi:hypothetical protein
MITTDHTSVSPSYLPKRDPFTARDLLRGNPCDRVLTPEHRDGVRVYTCGECHIVSASCLEEELSAGARARAPYIAPLPATMTGHELLRATVDSATVDVAGNLHVTWRVGKPNVSNFTNTAHGGTAERSIRRMAALMPFLGGPQPASP